MKSHVRVVVIGGGVVGCSVLYHLAKLGCSDALLIERSELTSGSTWHAAAGNHALHDVTNIAKLQKYTINLYKELEAETGQSCGIHQVGGIYLASSEERVNQLRLSLERLRWIDRDFPEKIVIVNIAGFETYLIHNRQIVWRSRVMVGKTYRKTPVFMGKMSYVQVNPTWTVPPTILRNDILPKVKRDPSYLRERNISVINRDGEIVDPDSVDWNSYGNSVPFTLRQEPGPTNALGRVKFIFPNPHFVFLHDTPSRQLFDRPDRTFSSGCIRVENPFELAELMIDDPGRWNQASFDRQLESGKIKTIYTKDKMPVLIMYWTAEAGLDGRIRFFKDVYERDERLLKALDGPVGFDLPVLPNR